MVPWTEDRHSRKGGHVIRDLPVAKLTADRQLGTTEYDQRQLDSIRTSMTATGLKVPLLVNTDMEVLDGLRRLTIAKELGWETIACNVTNDYSLMMKMVTQAREAGWDNDHMHVIDLHRRLNKHGEEYRQAQRRLGLDSRFKHLFLEASGFKAMWEVEQALDVVSGAERVRVRSPEHAVLVNDLLEFRKNKQASLGGVRQLLLHLRRVSASEGRVIVDNWKRRFASRQATILGVTEQQKKRALAASLPMELEPIHSVISSLEGLALGVEHIQFPKYIDPSIRTALLRRANKARSTLAQFHKQLKGNEQT